MHFGRRILPLTLFLLLFGWAPSDLLAQGGDRQDGSLIQELEEADHGTIADPLPRSIDLRPWLPAVGRQTMNDCVAWAFGYAGRTYLEAVDQGWRPDHPDRIFSPTFLYNQIVLGEDGGSLLPDAVALMQEKGAATLGTAPYLPQDYQTQPSAEALEEAQNFRILDYDLVENVESIKKALAEGGIVLVCARVNPEFMYGTFDLYDREVHDRGSVARRPDQPHGYHAMAIVGYNDDRQALLFMNSWGTDWGEDGFLWVAYDLLDTFNYGEDLENLLEFAVVMRDRREPVSRIDGKYQIVDHDLVEIGLLAQYAEVDEEGQQRFRYTATLRGRQEVLQGIKQVQWNVPTLQGTTSITTDAQGVHRVTAMTMDPHVEVEAMIDLGRSEPLSIKKDAFVPSGEAARSLRMQRHVAFHGRAEDKSPRYRTSFLPKMSDADWRALESITYEISGNDAGAPPAPYQHDGGLPPTWTPEQTAYLYRVVSEPLQGVAHLTFRDGTSYALTLPEEEFNVSTAYHPYVEADWRLEGRDGNRNWYYYQLEVHYPESWTEDLQSCSIKIGRNTAFQVEDARLSDGPEAKRYLFHGYTDVPFRAGATLTFLEDHPQFGFTYPAPSSAMIAVETDASWKDLFPDPTQLFNDGDALTLRSVSHYLGETSEGPLYRYDLFLEGTANVWAISGVDWTIPTGEVRCHRDEDDNPGPETGYAISLVAGPEPFEVSAHLLDAYDSEHDLHKTVVPHARRSNALYLDMTEYDVASLLREAPDRNLSRVRLFGMAEDLASVSKVEAIVPRAWGGSLRLSMTDSLPGSILDPNLGELETIRGQEVTFFLHHEDRSITTLRSKPHVRGPHPVAPRLQLEVRDAALGFEDGVHDWQVTAALRGDFIVREQIEGVTWTVTDARGQAVPFDTTTVEGSLTPRITWLTPLAGQVQAQVRFQASSGRAPMQLSAPVYLVSEALAQTPTAEWSQVFVAPADDTEVAMMELGYEDESASYEVSLNASPRFLKRWKEVHWRMRDLEAEEALGEDAPSPQVVVHAMADFADGVPRHTVHGYWGYAAPVQATLVAEDGTTLVLEEVIAGNQEEVMAFYRSQKRVEWVARYWGEQDGIPLSLLFCRIGDVLVDPLSISATYKFESPVEVAGGGPATTHGMPHGAREFLMEGANQLNHVIIETREDGYASTEWREKNLKRLAVTAADVIAQPTIAYTEGSNGLHHLHLEMAERDLVAITHVQYTVTQEGETTRYRISDRVGSLSDAFELRLGGTRPTSAQAQAFDGTDAVGEVLMVELK
ncbi:MAG: C1 family peptidase [Planctomycetota bacterium]